MRPTFDSEVEFFRQLWAPHVAANPATYYVMDESGVWDDSVVARTYEKVRLSVLVTGLLCTYCRSEQVGSRSAYVRSASATPKRDTIVATLCADGSKLPLYYLVHTRGNKKKGEPAIKGMNEELMLDYIEKVLVPYAHKPCALFMDNLSSHGTKKVSHKWMHIQLLIAPQVQERLREIGITPVFLPPYASLAVSPCDNMFFHLFKTMFRKMDRSTPQRKMEAAQACYEAITTEQVLSCWRKCKLIAHPHSDDETLGTEEEVGSFPLSNM